MDERRMKLLALLGIFLAIALPVGLSIFLARHESMVLEQRRAFGYAREVLSRTERTAEELAAGFKLLAASPDRHPCSDGNLNLMRRLDVSSSMVQAIGIMDGTRLVCSSLTGAGHPAELGPPQIRQPSGVMIWTKAELPFARGTAFLVVAQGRYAAIIHRTLPISVSSADPALVVAAVSTPRRVIITSRGPVQMDWLDRMQGGGQAAFEDDGYVVAVMSSPRFAISAIAGLPVTEQNALAWSIARWLVPCALLMGVLLAWAAVMFARSQLAMPTVLRAALKRNELFMVYQPVVDLRTGKWVGAEALIRWNRPGGESVRPDVFIVAAEDSGLIPLVTRQVVFEQVRRHAEIVFNKYPSFHIAINLAAEDLQSQRTVGLLHDMVASTGARDGSLMVEATERSFAQPSEVREIVNALRSAGIRIAIDDFGTGYSSLSFLESVNFDLLKIDKSFVDSLQTGAASSQVIHHIIEMAKALRLDMIAEGVETAEQAQFLRERGVHYAQGWLFAEAMPFEQLLEALEEQDEATQQVDSKVS
jgi:sensor c-di-GMP phosphodiesterase-like protein